MDAKGFAIIALVLGFIFATVSHASPFWVEYVGSGTERDVYAGLWQICGHVLGESLECIRIDRIDDVDTSSVHDSMKFLHLVRYLNITGPCLLLVASVCVILGSNYREVVIMSSLISGSAGCLLVASYTTFAVKVDPKASRDEYFHVCFYGAIVASVLAFVACAALLKLAMSFSAKVTPLNERTHPRPAPVHYTSNMDNGRMIRHTVPGARTPRNPGFAMASRDTLESATWRQTRIPSASPKRQPDIRNRTNQGHGFQDETWQESDHLQRGFHQDHSPRVHASHRTVRTGFLRPGMHSREFSRETRDSWLSEDIDMSPTPPGSAVRYTLGMNRVQRNLNF